MFSGPTTHFIDGEFVDGGDGDTIDVVNPADRSRLAVVPDGTKEDVDRAVAAARAAYRNTWRHVTQREKGHLLLRVADGLEARAEELARLETMENGKPLEQSRLDVGEAIRNYRFFGGLADKIVGSTIPERNGLFDYTIKEPFGVVGAIIPWNWPPMHTADFTAAPLAAGNTVVIKPAPETPLTTLMFAEVWRDVLPPGVVNVVTGAGAAGGHLVEHPDVPKIAFTGHDSTGVKVMQAAAMHIKSVMLELGGKNANIIFPDADLEAASQGAAAAFLKNGGQACTAGSRLLIHERVHDEVLERICAILPGLSIGDGMQPGVDLGPLASARQHEKVLGYIEIGKREGARVAYEGRLPEGLPPGYFVAPVIFADVTENMTICREEIFGPVLTVQRFSSFQECLDMANGTVYGLTAAVWTQNMAAANRIARELEAGVVFVNNYENSTFLGAPFGGFKKSGIGRKLGLEESIAEFTQSKTIRTAIMSATNGDLERLYS